MNRLIAVAGVVALLTLAGVAPVAAQSSVHRLHDIDTVLAVRVDDDFPLRSLMRATCESAQFVQLPDGSGMEKLHCALSAEPVMIPAFQGVAPSTAFVNGGGPCVWTSDFWWAYDGSIVMASSFAYVVTPSGNVNVTAWYPAEPLVCEE